MVRIWDKQEQEIGQEKTAKQFANKKEVSQQTILYSCSSFLFQYPFPDPLQHVTQ